MLPLIAAIKNRFLAQLMINQEKTADNTSIPATKDSAELF